jgi:hypothetical protein
MATYHASAAAREKESEGDATGKIRSSGIIWPVALAASGRK